MEGRRRVDFSKCNNCGDCIPICIHGGLKMIGKDFNSASLMNEIVKDMDFYYDSGGGVTLSGGEPMMNASFLLDLLPRIKEEGIHTAMETCGVFKWDQMEKLLPYLDLIYFDLKIMDGVLHKEHTGQDNGLILENYLELCERSKMLQARMPIIPGINDNSENIIATIKFLKEHGNDTIHCLPYHNLGEAKLTGIDTELEPLDLTKPSSDLLESIKKQFHDERIDAIIYD
jgi:pyruvate formate lyase activating enzyme